MKFLLTVFFAFLFTISVEAVQYKLDTAHSKVGFKVKHLVVSTVSGRFNKFEGTFDFDEKTGQLKNVDVSIDVSSVDTNEPDRDKHLSAEDFFHAKKFPKMTFKSKKVTYRDKKPVQVVGELMLHGQKKDVTLDVTYNGTVMDPWGNKKLGFEAVTEINRKDFGINWSKKLDSGGLVVGEKVKIEIEGEAKAQIKNNKKEHRKKKNKKKDKKKK